jgi:hypothetical protein
MKDEGLMFKILKILINEPADSLYRSVTLNLCSVFLPSPVLRKYVSSDFCNSLLIATWGWSWRPYKTNL